jgi:hypothetical protein
LKLQPQEAIKMITIKLIIYTNGSKYWRQNGKYHRDNDQPAIIDADGSKRWFQNNKFHRDNDQPAIINADGSKRWYQNDKFIKQELK